MWALWKPCPTSSVASWQPSILCCLPKPPVRTSSLFSFEVGVQRAICFFSRCAGTFTTENVTVVLGALCFFICGAIVAVWTGQQLSAVGAVVILRVLFGLGTGSYESAVKDVHLNIFQVRSCSLSESIDGQRQRAARRRKLMRGSDTSFCVRFFYVCRGTT